MNTVTQHGRHEIAKAGDVDLNGSSMMPGDIVLHCYDVDATGTVISSSGNTYAVLWARAPKRMHIDPLPPVVLLPDPVDSRWTSMRGFNDYEHTMSRITGPCGYVHAAEELFDGDEQYASGTLDSRHLDELQREGARLRFYDDGSVVASYRCVPRRELPARVHANPHRVNRWFP